MRDTKGGLKEAIRKLDGIIYLDPIWGAVFMTLLWILAFGATAFSGFNASFLIAALAVTIAWAAATHAIKRAAFQRSLVLYRRLHE